MEQYSFRIQDTITVSRDEEDRKDKRTYEVTVTYIFKGFTAEELAYRCLQSNSARVEVQTVLRKMAVIPKTFEFVVKKSGTRSGRSLRDKAVGLLGEAKVNMLEEKFGSIEAAMSMLGNLLED